jgi:hypothetical protein
MSSDKARRAARATSAAVRAHWLFAAFLTAGFALRVVAFLAYRPALFSPDARLYFQTSEKLEPSPLWPIAYPAFLRFLGAVGDLWTIPFAQHLLGLVVALLLYALLRRLDVRPTFAALATLPLLLDAYWLNVEEYVLSEAIFGLFLVGGIAALLWNRPLGVGAAALSAALFMGAALTRVVGILAFLPALIGLVLLTWNLTTRARIYRLLAFGGVAATLLGGYALWFHSLYGSYSIAGSTGRRIYARVAPWVDCSKFEVPAVERPLCPTQPIGSRPRPYELVWSESSPISQLDPPAGTTRNALAASFSRRAIVNEPMAYAKAVGADFLRAFAPTKSTSSQTHRAEQWRFQTKFPIPGYPRSWSSSPPQRYGHGRHGEVNESLASFLRTYQRFGYAPGPLLALGVLAALAALLGLGGAGSSRLRWPAFLFAGVALAVCFGSVILVAFSWRYQLPQVLLLPAAAVLGFSAVLENRRSPAREEPRDYSSRSSRTSPKSTPSTHSP